MDYKDKKLVEESFQKSASNGSLLSEWNRIHREFTDSSTLREIQRNLSKTEQGQKELSFMRQLWAKYDMVAPFDFIFEGDAEL